MAANSEDKAPLKGEELARYAALMGTDLQQMKLAGAGFAAATSQFLSDLKEAGATDWEALQLTKEFLKAYVSSICGAHRTDAP
jgi:hypothetical protein